jgi:hypothetical protein
MMNNEQIQFRMEAVLAHIEMLSDPRKRDWRKPRKMPMKIAGNLAGFGNANLPVAIV